MVCVPTVELPAPPATPVLRIDLLGSPEVTWAGRSLTLPRRQLRALLYRLAATAQPVPREQLCFLFWPDIEETTARRNLIVLLNHLRRALPRPDVLLTAGDTVGLDRDAARSDAVLTAGSLVAARGSRRLNLLREAVDLYRGPFLEGFALPAAGEFEAWVARERELWERRYLEALAALIEAQTARGDYAAAIATARRYLDTDELAEEVHRRLIALYAVTGDRTAALQQFTRCAEVLDRELSVPPHRKTRALYETVREGRTSPVERPSGAGVGAGAAPAQRDGVVAAAVRSAPASTLPAPATPLIGRGGELATARTLLEGGDVRLLTLCGTGGSGKTRLALEIAWDLRERFAHGAVFVPLAPLRDPTLVIGAIAKACGVQESGATALEDELGAHLRDKELLLVLDNCEHLLAAAPAIGRLLAAARGLRILATSRSLLNLAGEYALPVPPLEVPRSEVRGLSTIATDSALSTYSLRSGQAQHSALEPQQLLNYAAVRLFVARAQAVLPSFALTSENAEAVAAICVRLDGLPLAIELAAARLRLLSPRALLDRLDSRLSLLSGGPCDLPDRQQTLRAAIDWSYQLLNETGRVLLARLAVFAGGWTIEAAEAVRLGPNASTGGALEGMQALLDAHLLVRSAGADDEPRFGMLETVREYALERLAASDDAATIEQRHAAYFLELGETLRPRLDEPEQRAALRRLDADAGNMHAALAWARRSDEAALGLRLAGVLARYWDIRGLYGEGRGWLGEFLAGAATGDDAARIVALNGAATLARKQGDYAETIALATMNLPLCRARSDIAAQVAALGNLGLARYRQGKFPEAIAALEESVALRRKLANPWGLSGSLNNLAQAVHEQGDHNRAAALYGESLALKRHLGDARGACLVLNNLADLSRSIGVQARAVALADEGMALARELGDQRLLANATRNLGLLARDQGDYDQAITLFEESLALRQALGDRRGVGNRHLLLADTERVRGEYARAAAHYAESLAIARSTGDALTLAGCLEGMAGLGVACDRAEQAVRLLGAAAAWRDAMGAPPPLPNRPAVASAAATAGAGLGAGAWTVAWTTGRSLSPETAAGEAAALAAELAVVGVAVRIGPDAA